MSKNVDLGDDQIWIALDIIPFLLDILLSLYFTISMLASDRAG